MRVAIVSDVHGNRFALEAVVEELERRGPFDEIVGGGDFAAIGLYPHECVERVRELGWSCVTGNADEWPVQVASNGRFPVDLDLVPPEMRHVGERFEKLDAWTAERLTEEDVEFLGNLPLLWRTTGPSGQRLAFAHSTPWSSHPVFPPDGCDADAQKLLERADADAYFYGHIHYAYQRRIDGGLIGCVGAVGMTFDGDPRPCFGIATDDGDGWVFEHVRVAYDYQPYVDALLASDRPDAEFIARAVRTGER